MIKKTLNFIDIAYRFARNPLGIIALFVVLIYSIACLTFTKSKNLPDSAIGYFIAFILIYPLIIFLVFYRLVTKHHTKLYAPRDFAIPEDFVKCAYGDQSKTFTWKEVTQQKSETPDKIIKGKENGSPTNNI